MSHEPVRHRCRWSWPKGQGWSRLKRQGPRQYAVGVRHVLVNGVLVLRDGEPTGALPGRALWGPGCTAKDRSKGTTP